MKALVGKVTEEERNEILRNYLPDLSNYQRMSFNIKDEIEKKVLMKF